MLQIQITAREKELAGLKKALEEETANHENTISDMRHKHTHEISALNENLDMLKKNKTGLEKTKNSLEAENADLSAELKAAMASKQENERRRKQLESQSAELNMKLAEAEKNQGENNDKYSKLLTELEAMANNLNEAENKARYTHFFQFYGEKITNYFFVKRLNFGQEKFVLLLIFQFSRGKKPH